MSKIMLFAGNNYYPEGGWEDFRGEYDSIEEAKKVLLRDFKDKFGILSDGWAHFVEDGKIIETASFDDCIYKTGWKFEEVKDE